MNHQRTVAEMIGEPIALVRWNPAKVQEGTTALRFILFDGRDFVASEGLANALLNRPPFGSRFVEEPFEGGLMLCLQSEISHLI